MTARLRLGLAVHGEDQEKTLSLGRDRLPNHVARRVGTWEAVSQTAAKLNVVADI